jgi:hypothetical protein
MRSRSSAAPGCARDLVAHARRPFLVADTEHGGGSDDGRIGEHGQGFSPSGQARHSAARIAS